MSWSLRLRNGDLALSGASYGTVTGEEKLVQDLRCALLERMGTDPSHPGFGSLIDGGRTPDGNYTPGVIGETRADLVLLAIESDIRRIAREHQARQLTRAKSDRLTYNKSTLGGREVLVNVTKIAASQVNDSLNVTVTLQTAGTNPVSVDITVPNPTLLS